jgi:hypothetical protein
MKATRKVETISLKKKVLLSPKKVTKKKVSKKNSVFFKVSTTKDKLDSKLEKISQLHEKKVKNALPKTELLPKSFFSDAVLLRPKLEMALMSPYRFPIAVDSQKIAVGIARYGGVLFVMLGAISTVFFSQIFAATQGSQVALVAGTTSQQLIEGSIPVIDCTNVLQYGGDTCSTRVDKTPDVQLEVTGDRTSLASSVRVVAKVAFAKNVRLFARSSATGQAFDMGQMTNLNSNSWELYTDTTKILDGKYILKALITNAYGTYEHQDSLPVTIHNSILSLDHATGTATLQTDPFTPQTEGPLSIKAPQLRALSTLSASDFRFEVETAAADTVKMYTTQLPGTKPTFLGNAYKSSTNLWKYRWAAADYADAEYSITAQVIKDGVQITADSIRVTKKQVTTASSSASIAQTEDVLPQKEMKPEVTIDIQANLPLSGSAGLKIDVASAQKVEVYALKNDELTPRFLGNAKSVDIDTWVYYVNTKNIPNGEYRFVARVTSVYGSYDTSTERVKVMNQLAEITAAQTEKIESITALEKEVVSTLVAPKSEQDPIKQPEGVVQAAVEKLDIHELTSELDARLQRLAVAVRFGDLETIDKIKAESIAIPPEGTEEEKEKARLLKAKADDYINDALKKVEEKVALTNKLFEERTKEKATLDSDQDGIADYDEVTLFKTNPFSADSDADGFLDGFEVQGGFDPNNAESESLIAYESPKEAGLVKADLLEVFGVVSAPTDVEERTAKPAAIISGKALPNSFVSLYIFSTPIVVTVKTEADGSWAYRFDKELEDGEHEVFIGITDNAGKIVAKSNAFAFVKEAEAFTGATSPNTTAAPVADAAESDSLMSEFMIYLVLSISVVAIGLVLILLGLHLDAQARKSKKDEVVEEKPA